MKLPDALRPHLPDLRRMALVGATLLGTAVAVLVAVWLVDNQAHRGAVGRNVMLVDQDIGGMERSELERAVADLALRYRDADLEVRAEGGGFTAPATDIGVALDEAATTDAALDVGKSGFALRRLWSWATSFFSLTRAPVVLTVDEQAVRRVVAERDPRRVAPVEPNIAVRGDRLVAVEGKPGQGIDPLAVVRALRAGAGRQFPLVVQVRRTAVPPQFTLADAERVAAQAERVALRELPVSIGDDTATVPASTVRTWLRAVPSGSTLRLGIDADGAAETLSELFPEAGRDPVDAGFLVRGGRVAITPSREGTTCCAPEAAAAIEDALLNRQPGDPPVSLPLRTIPPSRDEEAARRLGIVEAVGSFTTNHAAGEPRVANIHRMADLVRGAVIPPGGSFSLNGHVGPRTREKGFVEAPVIDANYEFDTDVGGGVSQFSTTLFNAAFFAGLDIPTYGMHGIYISRYPYGREATLDYPSLDLRLSNPTPYGVLIWPSYTSSSITVTLYSTLTVSGEQTGQTTEEVPTSTVKPPPTTTAPPATTAEGDGSGEPAPGAQTPDSTVSDQPGGEEPEYYVCTRVITERTRTWRDGRPPTVDRFYALYAPEEGVVCPR